MVSKITIFEPHFDGAQFGPASIDGRNSGDDVDESVSDIADAESSAPFSLVVFAVITAGLILAVIARRRIRNGDKEDDLDTVEISKPSEDLPAN